jgi:hypothetical protein
MPPLWQLPFRAAEMKCRMGELDRAKDTDSGTSIQYITASEHSSSNPNPLQEAILLLDYLRLEALTR